MAATTYDEVGACVDAILDRLGTEIVVGTPLGIGKPNHILNELVERATANPEIDLEIWSALALSTPTPTSELERRLVDPLSERLFGDYPDLEYDRLLQRGALPDNIEVHKFYYQPGQYLDNPTAQQRYHAVNYTHALRTLEAAEPNLFLQLVGAGEVDGEWQYNFGSNVDLSQDLLASMREKRDDGVELMVVGQLSRKMPLMYGDAPVSTDRFDAVLDNERYDYPLFAPPHDPVTLVDHAIGLRVSALVRDGGTLQVGIGSLGDAVGSALELRHTDNEAYREAIDALGVREEVVERVGGLDPFETGLYGATEMFVESFLHLFESGVLTREVYDDPDIQRLVNAGDTGDGIDGDTLADLLETGVVPAELDGEDVAFLREWGVVTPSVEYVAGGPGGESGDRLVIAGESVPADLSDPETRARLETHGLGDSLEGGQVLHAGFFIGSRSFYRRLREMDDSRRRQFGMQSVLFTNQLYGQERLKRLQRRDARFVNTGLKATVTGAVASDGLEDGRVVSGVGGQFDFVTQAHELDGGRSILMIPATRETGDGVESNIVWNYGHTTVPRHLSDIVVTEYGVADLRGKADAEVIAEMVKIADSRFQADLVERATSVGKLPEEWELPAGSRRNTPETLEAQLGELRARGVLEEFPYGSAVTDRERTLGEALRELQSAVDGRDVETVLDPGALRAAVEIPDTASPYLERMNLARPATLRERALRRVVVFALSRYGAL